ncbi:unnamed protein product [Macrosiphum euphorbiae]|nr:unnamed protein product [Macrosiphum euphorbiae]
MGSCEVVRLCNGNVKDLNKPMNELECNCSIHEESFRYNGIVPVCRSLTVLEANRKYEDWQHLVPWVSDDLLPKQTFNATVQNNMNCSRLLNPCSHDLRDTTLRLKKAKYDSAYNTCIFEDGGVPVRTGVFKRHEGAVGPENGRFDTIDGALYSGKYSKICILDRVVEKRQMGAITTTFDVSLTPTDDPKTTLTVALPENTSVGSPGQVRRAHD